MEITREKTGELTATVKIHLEKSDYLENVNKVLKDYQRKAAVPGFRPGHVPFGMVKNLYGSAVFADELNKIVSENLSKYIDDEKLEVLGQPIPSERETPIIDWKAEQDIDFYFDLGFAPKFDLVLDEKISMDYHLIKADDAMVDKYVDDMRQRFGQVTNPETVGQTDLVLGNFEQLAADGTPLEGGITHEGRVAVDKIADKDILAKFLGAMAGDQLIFNPAKLTGNITDTAAMLAITKEEAEAIDSDFRFSISEISTMSPAEMNEEFYNKVFPELGITDEKQFREKIRQESETAFLSDSDHLFVHTAQDKLTETVAVQLPDEFMKRWIYESNQGKISKEDIDRDYAKYAEGMKWQLIESRIISEAGIQVSDEEIKDYVKDYYLQGWRTMPLTDELSRRLDEIATSFMKDKPRETRNIMDSLYAQRIASYIKSKVKLVNKEITYEEFIKLDAAKH